MSMLNTAPQTQAISTLWCVILIHDEVLHIYVQRKAIEVHKVGLFQLNSNEPTIYFDRVKSIDDFCYCWSIH